MAFLPETLVLRHTPAMANGDWRALIRETSGQGAKLTSLAVSPKDGGIDSGT